MQGKEFVMKPIRTALASIGVAAGLALSAFAHAQSAPLPYTLQVDPAIPNITTPEQQDEVMKLVTAHLGLWLTRDPDTYPYERLVTDDAVFEYPYAEVQATRRVEGRSVIARALRDQAPAALIWQFSDVKLFQTAHSDIFFVQYSANGFLPTGERVFEQHRLARVTVRDGQIANYYELWERALAGAPALDSAHN
jgi:ketosteroid isomerase-like protein